MSNMCTCHIDPDKCDWCRVQNVKSFCKLVTNPGTFIKDILIVAEQLEERLLKEVAPQNEAEDWEGGSFAPFRPVDLSDSCGGCRFFDTKTGRCSERNIFVKSSSPKCPQWRYFA